MEAMPLDEHRENNTAVSAEKKRLLIGGECENLILK